jgi:hypothetical protein
MIGQHMFSDVGNGIERARRDSAHGVSLQQSILDKAPDAPVEQVVVGFVTLKKPEVTQLIGRNELGVQNCKSIGGFLKDSLPKFLPKISTQSVRFQSAFNESQPTDHSEIAARICPIGNIWAAAAAKAPKYSRTGMFSLTGCVIVLIIPEREYSTPCDTQQST